MAVPCIYFVLRRFAFSSNRAFRLSLRNVSSSNQLHKTVKDINFKQLSDAEWARRLTPLEYKVCREGATEHPFAGEYYTHYASGVYTCTCCGSELFSSTTKYDSKCGWPSFYASVNGAVQEKEDLSHGMIRIEAVCSKCDAHLGHVFSDGPPPTGLRYCINSVCLKFLPKV